MFKHYVSIVLLAGLLITSCKEDVEPLVYSPALTTGNATDLTRMGATLQGTSVQNVNSTESPEIGFLYATSAGLNNPSETEATSDGGNNYTAVVSGLKPNQTYYYCIFARSGNAVARGAVSTFSTAEATSPVVSIASMGEITEASVALSATIIDNGGYEPTVRGFAYALYVENAAEPTTDGTTVLATGSDFAALLTDLAATTTYIVRPYATSEAGTGYGEAVTFTTGTQKNPLVGIGTPTDIAALQATCIGSVTASYGFDITEQGFCYSAESQLPTTAGNHVVATGTGSNFTATLTALEPNTRYYVRAYAVNERGTGYSSTIELTTEKEQVVSLTQATVTALTSQTATITAIMTYEAGTLITEKGICYGTTSNPDVNTGKVQDTTSPEGELATTVSGLSEGILYYARAYAVTRDGTFYSGEIAFTTETTYTPTIGRPTVYDLTETGAKVRATISTDGGEDITERGIVYSATNATPTTDDTRIVATDTDSGISATLTGLQGGVTYYVRAYAVNLRGTGYSTVTQFTTTQHTAPVVSSINVTDIGDDYATASAYLANAGGEGETVSERGFVVSLYENPTVDNGTKFAVDGTDALFTTLLTGLSYNSRYYIRAYAVNAIGTGYSHQISIYTGSSSKPTLGELVNTETKATTLSFSFTIENNGGADITEAGFKYYRSDEGSSNVQTAAGTVGSHTVTGTLTGLTEDTRYYIYGYATNKNGEVRTSSLYVSTEKLPPGSDDNPLPGDNDGIKRPTVSSVSVSNIHSTYAKFTASITADNGSAVTEKGFIWCPADQGNPSADNGTRVRITDEGNNLTYVLTELTAGTAYRVCAYATNAKGTTYGNTAYFTTEADKPEPGDDDNPTPGEL